MTEKTLLIVESPAKAGNLSHIVGKHYIVEACGGHLMEADYERSKAGPSYRLPLEFSPPAGKRMIIRRLQTIAARVARVVIATDPDREGEVIAQHLHHLLGGHASDIQRVCIFEYTASGVAYALENPCPIDEHLVQAQHARVLIDRMVSHLYSAVLRRVPESGSWASLHIGRVQAAVLQLLLERSRQHEEPGSLPYTVEADFASTAPQASVFTAQLSETLTAKQAQKLAAKLMENPDMEWTLRWGGAENNRHCYTTAELLQDAALRLGFGSGTTMRLARKLFEGIPLNGGRPTGLITYYRTDSTRINREATKAALKYLRDRSIDTIRTNGRLSLTAQPVPLGAHEAIRPTLPLLPPESVALHTTREVLAIYTLIFERFLTIHKKNTPQKTSALCISSPEYKFVATAQQDAELPTGIVCRAVRIVEAQVPGQAYYDEASLIRDMATNNIGRPSSYAATCSALEAQGYTVHRQGWIHLTPEGKAAASALARNCPELVAPRWCAWLEHSLAELAGGEEEPERLLQTIQDRIQAYKHALKNVPVEQQDRNNPVCEQCGAPMCKRRSSYGEFYACSRYPACKATRPVSIGVQCPVCTEGHIVQKAGGPWKQTYYICNREPVCTFSSREKPLNRSCLVCDSTWLIVRWRRGIGEYPECPNCGKKFDKFPAPSQDAGGKTGVSKTILWEAAE